jgi:hypothetical protein
MVAFHATWAPLLACGTAHSPSREQRRPVPPLNILQSLRAMQPVQGGTCRPTARAGGKIGADRVEWLESQNQPVKTNGY